MQGFGQQIVDASGASIGTVTIGANQISRYITFSVDKTALGGTPAIGWTFTVALTGQDGSPDQTRGFQHAGAIPVRRCAAASVDPLCAGDPNACRR